MQLTGHLFVSVVCKKANHLPLKALGSMSIHLMVTAVFNEHWLIKMNKHNFTGESYWDITYTICEP
jgi:hypothetical protein